jgi:hypothetical protein
MSIVRVRGITWSATTLALVGAVATAAFAGAGLSVQARNPKTITSDGEHLIFAFELAAANGGNELVSIRAIDYSVSIQGTRFFSGTAQGSIIEPAGERAFPIAGFTAGDDEERIVAALRGTEGYSFRVSGVLHLRTRDGGLRDQPFASEGHDTTPEKLAVPRPKPMWSSYSLLSR